MQFSPKNLILILSIVLNLALGCGLIVASLQGTAVTSHPLLAIDAGGPQEDSLQPAGSGQTTSPDQGRAIGPGADAKNQSGLISNLSSYLAYLQQQGLPEKTIRQIILGSIEEEYTQLSARDREKFHYWKQPQRDAKAQVGQELQWAEEKRQLLRSLFGDGVENDPLFAELFRPLDGRLGFLSSAKQIAIDELRQRARSENAPTSGRGFSRDGIAERRDALADLLASVQETLTPEEFVEYQLRDSMLSEMMRRSMADFDYTEQEFREIYGIRQEAQSAALGDQPFAPGDPQSRQGLQSAREEMNSRVRDYLGEARYKELQKVQDPLYRSLQSVGEKHGNSPREIDAAYEISSTYQDQIAVIRNDSSLSADDRRSKVAKLAAETNKKIEDVVGAEAAKSIEQNTRRMLFSPRFGRRS